MTQLLDSTQDTKAQDTDSTQLLELNQDTDSTQDTKTQNINSQSDETPSPPEKKSPHRRWVWLLAGAAVLAGIGGGYWWLRPQPDTAIALSGRLEGYETDVSTREGGRVEEVTVREGTEVTQGQLLVRLEGEELQSELAAATAQVEAAKQREAAALLQIAVLENQVADAQLNLQQSEGSTAGQVAEAEALVATAQAMHTQEQARVGEATALRAEAQIDSDRFARLASLGAATQQRDDLARTALKTSTAAVQSREAAVVAAAMPLKSPRENSPRPKPQR